MQLSFDFCMIEAKLENLIGDRAYDSDKLDEKLRQDGIEMIAPHKRNRVRTRTQDGRRLRCYERRWLVESFFAWIQCQRLILVQWEYHAENFLFFMRLGRFDILLEIFENGSKLTFYPRMPNSVPSQSNEWWYMICLCQLSIVGASADSAS